MSWINKITSKLHEKQGTKAKESKIPENSPKSGEQKGKKSSDKNSSREYIAVFPNLIDLVEDNGKPAFLIKIENELHIQDKIILNGKTFYPPDASAIPFTLAPSEEVQKYIKKKIELAFK